MVVAGVFDRFPGLQVVLGHWGETVAFFAERINLLTDMASSRRSMTEYLRDNVLIAPSGIYSSRYLRWAIETVGIDRVVMSTDHPFVPAPLGAARRFVDEAPIDEEGRTAIGSANWERVTRAIRR